MSDYSEFLERRAHISENKNERKLPENVWYLLFSKKHKTSGANVMSV